nr:urease accessory protein UreF [Polynucleobacter rarus]
MMPNPKVLNAMLHLASPALPIGGFSYSQGLEAAINIGLVHDQVSAKNWIQTNLHSVIANAEAIIWVYLFQGWQNSDLAKISYWNQWFWASRETSEFRAETIQMGWSLAKLMQELERGTDEQLKLLKDVKKITLPCAHSYACQITGMTEREGLQTYLYSWIENQVMAAMKSVPLGQVAGQKTLLAILDTISDMMDEIFIKIALQEKPINTFSIQLSVLSARHESQYSRLFRS